MPIPEDIVRCRIRFTMGQGTGQETAVMGWHMGRKHVAANTVNWPADVQTLSDKIADSWVANMTNKSQFSSDIAAQVTEVYHLDAATGHTLDKGQTGMTGARAWVGTSTNPSLPFAVAEAVSLYAYAPGSFTPNKRSKMGRFYLPPLQTSTVDSGSAAGLIQAGNANTLFAAVNAFLEDIHGKLIGPGVTPADSDQFYLVVLSRTTGLAPLVTNTRLGHRFDVQRRRENKLPETYLEHALVYP